MDRTKIADALRRAGRTFIQAAGAYLALNPNHAATGKALAVGALGAGLAAVWRMLDPADPKPESELEAPSTKAGETAGHL